MWPFSSYPERQAEEVDGKTYDYIVVGGGCAGCVLASRLSEDAAVSVLLLEKGHVAENFLSRIPLLSQNYRFPFLQAVARLSEPIEAIGGRRARMWTTEGLGGATRINAMLVTRGVPAGFEEWAQAFGLADWGWDQVEPYFRKSENAVSHPDAEHRGHGGIWENRQTKPMLATYAYFEKAARAVGLPVSRDLNDPAAGAQGYFYLDYTIAKKGTRLSTYSVWMNSRIANERRAHLSVCTGVVASKLEIDASGKQVTGVHLRRAGARSSGRGYFVKARREVIVCGGAICSPQLLMLSGVGPRHQADTHGIPLVHELPAVGENLTDHCSVPIMVELPWKDTCHYLETALGFLWHLLLYLVCGTGFLAGTATFTSIFLRTTALDEKTMTVKPTGEHGSTMDAFQPRNIPDTEVMLIPMNSFVDFVPGRSFSSFYTALLQPFSRGRVELASSTDPGASPRIIYPMLSDPRDLAAMRRATRFSMRLAEEFANSGYPHPAPLTFAPGMDLEYVDSLYKSNKSIAGMLPDHKAAPDVPAPSLDGKRAAAASASAVRKQQAQLRKLDWRSVTDQEIDDFVKKVCASCFHLSSTCRMSLGPEDGVVDQRLRVHGLRNLRIADASVFPKIPSAHTMAPTVMVAERCADFLKSDWAESKSRSS